MSNDENKFDFDSLPDKHLQQQEDLKELIREVVREEIVKFLRLEVGFPRNEWGSEEKVIDYKLYYDKELISEATR